MALFHCVIFCKFLSQDHQRSHQQQILNPFIYFGNIIINIIFNSRHGIGREKAQILKANQKLDLASSS